MLGSAFGGRHDADQQAHADIQRGITVACALGREDVGQSVIVQQGMVLGVEAIEGTTALIQRCAALHREGQGGVLVKIKKPSQTSHADLPVVGPETVRCAGTNRLRGIAVQAEHVIVLERRNMINLADSVGLFLIGVNLSHGNGNSSE